MINIKIDGIAQFRAGDERHPQRVMEDLGISYKRSIPLPTGDCWLFEDCASIPELSSIPTFIELQEIA